MQLTMMVSTGRFSEVILMKNMDTKVKLVTKKLKTSQVQKFSTAKVKKQVAKVKKVKAKQINTLSVKDKLIGKNYSPTIENAKNKLRQTGAVNVNLHDKVLSTRLPNRQKLSKVVPVSAHSKIRISPAQKNKKIEIEKIVAVKVKSGAKNNELIASDIAVKKPKASSKKEVKSIQSNKNLAQSVTNKGIKRNYKPEKLELPTKQEKKIRKKVEVENETIPFLVELKKGDQPIVAKPQVTKMKRKSSTASIQDLKPISNIKSLVKRKPLKKSMRQNRLKDFPERGVCYFSHIPNGFYEKELRKYCRQFGCVTGVYHPVSKQGNSRGYAFVEFKHKEVAEVVAETMNNYLMFNRLIKCEYIPPEYQRPWVFKQDRDNKKAASLRRKKNLSSQMRNLTNAEVKKWKKRRLARVNSIHKKLADLEADYEFQVNDTKITEVKEDVKDIKSEV